MTTVHVHAARARSRVTVVAADAGAPTALQRRAAAHDRRFEARVFETLPAIAAPLAER